jgi:hypothetical protein
MQNINPEAKEQLGTITRLPHGELASAGRRLEAADLLAQADYTLIVASMDGERLAGLLPPGYLLQVRKVQQEITAAISKGAMAKNDPELALKLGLLYEGLKTISRAGQSLYISSPQEAEVYNLDLVTGN